MGQECGLRAPRAKEPFRSQGRRQNNMRETRLAAFEYVEQLQLQGAPFGQDEIAPLEREVESLLFLGR